MKSKVNEKDKKRWEKYRGVLRRRDLRNIVKSTGTNGITASQIMTRLLERGIKISKVQLYNYLNEECTKHRFSKKGTRYYVRPLVTADDWSILSSYINDLQYFSNFNDLWLDREFQSNFQKNSLENILIQFSNRAGALLCYTIIEALRPTENLKLIHDRKELAIKFVRDAISPEYLLQTFLATLPFNFREKYGIGPWQIITDEQGKNKKSMIKNNDIAPEINELYITKNQNPMISLIDAYNRAYPHLHNLLEKNFKKYVNREEVWTTCDHQWEPTFIHSIGSGYKCSKCSRKITEEKFNDFSKLN